MSFEVQSKELLAHIWAVSNMPVQPIHGVSRATYFKLYRIYTHLYDTIHKRKTKKRSMGNE